MLATRAIVMDAIYILAMKINCLSRRAGANFYFVNIRSTVTWVWINGDQHM